jgi:hypothetical protein
MYLRELLRVLSRSRFLFAPAIECMLSKRAAVEANAQVVVAQCPRIHFVIVTFLPQRVKSVALLC